MAKEMKGQRTSTGRTGFKGATKSLKAEGDSRKPGKTKTGLNMSKAPRSGKHGKGGF